MEDTGNSLKFHHFWLKLFTFLTGSGSARPGGLCLARMGHSGRALGTLQEGAWEKGGSCGSWVGKGGGDWWALLIAKACRWLDQVSPHAVPAGFALARGKHSTCSPPAPGAQVARKGDIKRTSVKEPVWHRRGGSLQWSFPKYAINFDLIRHLLYNKQQLILWKNIYWGFTAE